MRDGKKEAAKELMATLRMLVADSLSALALLVGLKLRKDLTPADSSLLAYGIFCAVASIVSCSWLFFLVIRKLYEEDEDVIDKLPAKVLGGSGVFFFVLAALFLFWSIG